VARLATLMAKSDSFFIRKTVNIDNTNAFFQGTIDCGAYVDALGKSVLRIHNLAVTFSDSSGRSVIVASEAAAQFQLTTQQQSDIVLPSDKAVIASGRLTVDGAGGVATYVSQDFDVLPQHWTNGYLVGVEQIYLGGAASTGFSENVYVSVVMECTVETMTSNAAMALALSQQ
jgi:hypothetical protein